MGNCKDRLNSLEFVPALPGAGPPGVSSPAMRSSTMPCTANGTLGTRSVWGEPLAFELAAEFLTSTSNGKKMSIQDDLRFSGSLFSHMRDFNEDANASVYWNRPLMPSLFGGLSVLNSDGHTNSDLNKTSGVPTALRDVSFLVIERRIFTPRPGRNLHKVRCRHD